MGHWLGCDTLDGDWNKIFARQSYKWYHINTNCKSFVGKGDKRSEIREQGTVGIAKNQH